MKPKSIFHAAVLLLMANFALFGQDPTGRLVGTATDSQGAAIAGARIVATNVETQIVKETVTDDQGNYQILNMPIGTYRVTGEKAGFRKTVIDGQKLQINSSLRIDVRLEVGAVSEVVEVQSAAAGVETVNATLGASVTSRPIVDMPLNGRNVLQLALLMPGVVETRPGFNPGGSLFSVSGGRPDGVTYILDGGMNNNLLSNGIVYNPNPDAVQEFRILTSNYTAETGRNAGGIISVVTKSGTNELHGSAYDFIRNDKFNANDFFNNRNGLKRDVLKRNQFGVTAGAPILIPKLFNGKNRAFFFISYQGQRLSAVNTNGTITTYTPAEIAGDFSRSGPGGAPDSGVVAFLRANTFFQSNPDLASRAIIDPNRINGVAKKYISSNLIPTAATGQLFPGASATQNNDEITPKIDYLITQNDRITLTLGARRYPRLAPFPFTTSPSGYGTLNNTHSYFGNLAYSRVFSPHLLNEFRFTAQRNNGVQAVPSSNLPTASQLGVGITPDNPTGPPIVSFATDMTVGFSPQGPTTLIDNTYIYSDAVTWTRGRHNFKFGATLAPYQNNTVYDFYVNGQFFFRGSANAGGIGSGNARADFLFGTPDEYLQFGEAPSNIRSKNFSSFFQDEWRVTKRLTLTLGLRYEYSQPKLDLQGRSFSLKYGAQSTRFTKAPVGLLFPGDTGAPRGSNFADKNDWAPRFGFALDPKGDGKMSIRGGFGVFYDILKGEDNLQFNGQAPFFGYADLGFDLPSRITADIPILSAPFVTAGVPNSFPSRPPAKDIDFEDSGYLPFGGGGVYFVDPNLRTPYIYHYNLSVQREVARNMTGEIAYVGSSAHKLTSLVDTNPVIRGRNVRLFSTQPGTGGRNDLFSYLAMFGNVAHSNYNSLQTSLTKRPSSTGPLGTTYFTLGYTYSHSLDNASGFRDLSSKVPYYNWNQFIGSSDFDVRHRVTLSGGWDLPFDRAWQRGPSRLTKGWSLYPIFAYRTGFPVDVRAGIAVSRTRLGPSGAGDADQARADLVGSGVTQFDPRIPQTLRGRTGNYWFDPTNFSAARFTTAFDNQVIANPSLATYGTLGRNAFTGPNRTSFDLTVAKKIPLIGERVAAEIRADFFNIFNHAQFNQPQRSITSATFGQITSTIADPITGTSTPRIIQLAMRLTF